MKRRLLVLTAGVWQVPVICTAKSMRLHVIVTDQNPGAQALAHADAVEIVDTRDRDAVRRIAETHRVDGVVAEHTDVATAAYVAETLGLPGIGLDTATAATNKFVMRERCREAGLPTPSYIRGPLRTRRGRRRRPRLSPCLADVPALGGGVNGESFFSTTEADVEMNRCIANCTLLLNSGDWPSAVTHARTFSRRRSISTAMGRPTSCGTTRPPAKASCG